MEPILRPYLTPGQDSRCDPILTETQTNIYADTNALPG